MKRKKRENSGNPKTIKEEKDIKLKTTSSRDRA